jgi:hypothetical protein
MGAGLTITESKLILDLAAARAEIEELRAWKESALAVEREWDCQEIARELRIPLGQSIRKGILPAIRELKIERDAWENRARQTMMSNECFGHEVVTLLLELEAARKAIAAKDALLREMMSWHIYCKKDPCRWCQMAQATFDTATKGEQP